MVFILPVNIHAINIFSAKMECLITNNITVTIIFYADNIFEVVAGGGGATCNYILYNG